MAKKENPEKRDIADMCITTYGDGNITEALYKMNSLIASKETEEYDYLQDCKDTTKKAIKKYGKGDVNVAVHAMDAIIADVKAQAGGAYELFHEALQHLGKVYVRPTDPGVRSNLKQFLIDIDEFDNLSYIDQDEEE